MNEERLIELETKITFQEQVIEDLHALVYEHEKAINRLTLALVDMERKLDLLKDSAGPEIGPANEKPPHY